MLWYNSLFKGLRLFWACSALCRYADSVSIGDEVLVPENDQIVPVKIYNISNFLMQGKILP